MKIKNFQLFVESLEQAEQVFSDLGLSFEEIKPGEWKVWYPDIKTTSQEVIQKSGSFFVLKRFVLNEKHVSEFKTMNLKGSLISEYAQFGTHPSVIKQYPDISDLYDKIDELPDKMKIPFIAGKVTSDTVQSLDNFGLFEKFK